ncbi:MAG: hypothetical protein ACE5E7_03965 [Anaerolineae bacterium]
MTPETLRKREQFQEFVAQVLEPERAVKAVIGIGSIAAGHMHAGSDIDAVIFLEPLDFYIVPAETIWRPSDHSFHTILKDDPELLAEGITLDFLRLNWQQWSDPEFEWPEGVRAELSRGWIVFERDSDISAHIAQRTAYPDSLRLDRLDEAITRLDQHLNPAKLDRVWDTLGPVMAHDRLETSYHYLVQALFAFNRQWRPWRSREMGMLLNLSWLPDSFDERVLVAANAPSLDREGYDTRAQTLSEMFRELQVQLTEAGDYSNAPIDQAFIRSHDEPGRAWNMDEWLKFYTARRAQANGAN